MVSPKEHPCQACPDDATGLLTAYYEEQKKKFAELTGETFGEGFCSFRDPSIGDASQASTTLEDADFIIQ